MAEDNDGDERCQLFRVDLARPGDLLPLTEPSPPYFLRGGQLHPNGRWLIYGANYDAEAGHEIEPTWVYRHDVVSEERVALARPARSGWVTPDLNPPGTHILYSRNEADPAGQQVWLVDIEGRDDREVINVGAARKVSASWLPDGTRAIVLAETDTHRRVGLWDLETGGLRWLLDDPDRNVEDVQVPHGSDHAVVVEVKEARVHASLLAIETGHEARIPSVAGELIPLAPAGGGAWVGSYGSARHPDDLVRFVPTNRQPDRFVSLSRVWERTELTAGDLAPAEDIRWRSADGLSIQGWLYRPLGLARGTIVSIHGGPTAHSRDRMNPLIQFLVARGFTVLDPNYRGSTGFGQAFQEAIKEDGWGGREQADIQAGITALIERGIAVPGKVGVTGVSYGGYSSWCAITRYHPEEVMAAAPVCGMTDLVVDYETTRPDQVPERYRERSPINFVSDIKGRLLIVQGLRDPNVTPRNVQIVREAQDQAGVSYDVLTFADEGHGIKRPKNQKVLYQRLAEFFAGAFAP
ncbi:MAG TPA: prolyl oligopeptidase family serine peptidase [Chloroflexota bacterium]